MKCRCVSTTKKLKYVAELVWRIYKNKTSRKTECVSSV